MQGQPSHQRPGHAHLGDRPRHPRYFLIAAVAFAAVAAFGCGTETSSSPAPDTGTGGDASGDGGVDAAVDDDGGGPDAGAGDNPCGCVAGECVEVPGEGGEVSLACDCGRRFEGDTCADCADGYAGEDCTSCAAGYRPSLADPALCAPDVCADETCAGHGTCRPVPDVAGAEVAVCDCDPAFDGADCLECAVGYAGADCEACADAFSLVGGECVESACLAAPCGPRGMCSDPDGDGTGACECDRGWDGRTCEECAPGFRLERGECVLDACFGLDCGPGSCAVGIRGTYCDCPDGYAGASCDECAAGYTLVTAGGAATCENVNPVGGRQLKASYDAMDFASFDVDAMGNVNSWYGSPGRLWRTDGSPTTTRRPRYTLLPPAVQFDGVDDDLSAARRTISSGERYLIFIVASWDPADGRQTILDTNYLSTESEAYSLDVNGSTVRFRHRGFADGAPDTVTSTDFNAAAGRQLIMIQRAPFLSGTALTLSNGTDATTIPSTTTAFGEEPFVVVGRCLSYEGDGDCHFGGRLHEMVFYEGVVTAAERDSVAAYLTEKWSL